MVTVINNAQNILQSNPEWINRYEEYADILLANMGTIHSNRKKFNEFSPLYFYISTSKALNAKTKLSLDLRYRGQSVATLIASKKGITLSTKSSDYNNKRDFDCDIKLDNEPWRTVKASEFRKYFKNRPNSRNDDKLNKSNEEHNVESLLLTEFSKSKSVDKPILNMQPINIGGIRFPMPTPLSASNHNELNYAKGKKGGGIDIFCRTGRGRGTYLTVIEIKDENNKKEPPKDALKQAIQYAVFIQELLRSSSGDKWYKIFGFNGPIPKKLTIRAVCAMPDDFPDQSFAKDIYNIGGDIIKCHYIYFKYDGTRISDFQTSLK